MQWIEDLERFIFLEDMPVPSDIIFVPGNARAEPCEFAAELYRRRMAPLVLPSGRFSITAGRFPGQASGRQQYPGSFETEWEFMHAVLLANGVPEACILQEDQATFTYENAIYSRQVTDRLHLSVRSALIVCLPVHARRAKMYYETLFPDAVLRVCPAQSAELTRKNWMESREGIDRVLGEVERCGSQFHEILTEILQKEKKPCKHG